MPLYKGEGKEGGETGGWQWTKGRIRWKEGDGRGTDE